MEKFHFLLHLEAKTNKRKAFHLSPPIIRNKNKQRRRKSFPFPTERAENKISMEKPLPEKERRRKTRNVCVNISFHLVVSRGGFHSYLKWENLFLISRSFYFSPLCSSASDDVSYVESIGWSGLLSSRENKTKSNCRDDDNKGSRELLKVNILARERHSR